MLINYWAVLGAAVLAMVLGGVWYGPMFGKVWMRITGCTDMDEAKKREMQKKMAPMYAVTFVLVVFQLWILVHLTGFSAKSGIVSALWIWGGFVMPTIAGTSMWNNDSKKDAWMRFFIQAGYQLVCFIMFGAILGIWH